MSGYLLQHYVDRWARIQPRKLAVTSPSSEMTYRELYESSNRLAAHLARIGVRRQDRVAFCMERTPLCIVAILSILKSDAIYVPIDPKAPVQRFLRILQDCRPAAILLDSRTAPIWARPLSTLPHPPTPVLIGDDGAAPQSNSPPALADPPQYRNVDTDIAYILYTSGSTGDPKGVMISHLNIFNYINWAADTFNLTAPDVVLSTAPFHFDMSTFDVYCPLWTGAALAIATEKLLLFPGRLVKFIEDQGVTLWKGISSLLMYMARTRALEPGRMPELKRIIFSGEVLPTKYLIEWMRHYPGKEFYNAYGPTEATGISTYYRVPAIPGLQEMIPIGKPCANTEILLLNESRAPVPAGETGELCIRGSGVSCGYWNDIEKTAAAFIPNPLTGIGSDIIYRTGDLARQREDGEYEFIGRKDSQIKLLGYRIEIGEIETALRSLEGVCDAAVLLHNGDVEQEFTAFVEVENSRDAAGIMAELKKLLPEYMLPRHFVPMQRLPRTGRGKIDRVRLKQSLDSVSLAAQTAGS